MFRYTLYVYLHVPWCSFGSPVHYTAACIPRMPSRTCSPSRTAGEFPREPAYNYFYELVIMTCNHDIAYLVRNANTRVQSGAAPGHAREPVAATTQRPLFTVHEISVNVNMCF